VLRPVADNDSPSCRDGTGPRAFLKEGLCTTIAGIGSGPEGSKPTAGNCRLQVFGGGGRIGINWRARLAGNRRRARHLKILKL